MLWPVSTFSGNGKILSHPEQLAPCRAKFQPYKSGLLSKGPGVSVSCLLLFGIWSTATYPRSEDAATVAFISANGFRDRLFGPGV
jgi:hypothetical protein